MPVNVEVGGDLGTSIIRTDTALGVIAQVDRGASFRVSLERGGTYLTTVTDLAGTAREGGVIPCDRLGMPKTSVVTIPDLDAPPPELWFHRVGSAPADGWYRYRLGGGGASTGGGGGGGLTSITRTEGWYWSGTDIASGRSADPLPLFESATVARQVVQAVGGIPSGPTVVQWRCRNAATGVAADVGGPVTLPTGSTMVYADAGGTDVPGGTLWADMVTAPPSGTAGGTAVTQVAAATYSSAASTATSYTMPLPAGGAAGDVVLAMISLQSPIPVLGSAWTRRGLAASVPSGTQAPRAKTVVYTAPWSASLDMSLALDPYTPPGGTTATSSPLAVTVVILPAADGAAPVVDVQTVSPDNAAGPSLVYPALTASAATDLTYVVTTWHELSGITGQSSAITPDPAAEVTDVMTTRTSATNIGQQVARYGALAAGASLASRTVTVSGGTGSLTSTSMSGVTVTIKRAPGVSAPTKIYAWAELTTTPAA